jgi:hypothetical protein
MLNIFLFLMPGYHQHKLTSIPSPDDGLNSYNSLQLSACVTSIEAYGHGYVAIDVQLLLDDEDFPAIRRCSGNS